MLVREGRGRGGVAHALLVGDVAEGEVPGYAAGVGGEGVVEEDDVVGGRGGHCGWLDDWFCQRSVCGNWKGEVLIGIGDVVKERGLQWRKRQLCA